MIFRHQQPRGQKRCVAIMATGREFRHSQDHDLASGQAIEETGLKATLGPIRTPVKDSHYSHCPWSN
jgi:hypothetical protein